MDRKVPEMGLYARLIRILQCFLYVQSEQERTKADEVQTLGETVLDVGDVKVFRK